MKLNKTLLKEAVRATNRQNMLEEKIAREWYGCSYDELDYDDKELVSYEAIDRM